MEVPRCQLWAAVSRSLLELNVVRSKLQRLGRLIRAETGPTFHQTYRKTQQIQEGYRTEEIDVIAHLGRSRVTGKTWWEWVFVGTLAVLHIIRPSRGKA